MIPLRFALVYCVISLGGILLFYLYYRLKVLGIKLNFILKSLPNFTD